MVKINLNLNVSSCNNSYEQIHAKKSNYDSLKWKLGKTPNSSPINHITTVFLDCQSKEMQTFFCTVIYSQKLFCTRFKQNIKLIGTLTDLTELGLSLYIKV